MRDKMPTVAAFIDKLRAAFGVEVIDDAIRRGLRNGTFHAREAGFEVGIPVIDEPDHTVRLDQMFPFNDA
jgi:hypothetical protein